MRRLCFVHFAKAAKAPLYLNQQTLRCACEDAGALNGASDVPEAPNARAKEDARAGSATMPTPTAAQNSIAIV